MTHEDFYKNPTVSNQALGTSSAEPLSLPKMIGGYKIESLLNKGGMSLLYLGIHPQTHEPIAIKVLSAKYLSSTKMVARFLKEAEIIELTNHPNIIKLYGHGTWEGGVYIAMEFVQGISLRQMILQEAMSLKRALEVVLQISYALTHLHAHGIIHRDLKPENILLTAQGGIKVIDFGISQLFSEKLNAKASSSFIGTPVYMSPEQKEDPLKVGFSSDIYSLGLIIYELVLGKLSHGVVHLAVIPRGLQKILSKCLQPDPKKRYEDIVDLITDISAYLSSEALKKDMRGSDYLVEMSENLKEAQAYLIPERLPKWKRLEMVMSTNSTTALSSVYYDFFSSQNGVYHIVMGESLTTGVEGLLRISTLKGMVQGLGHHLERPTDFVAELNRCVAEFSTETYSFSLLSLYLIEERLSYISCGYSPLWYLPSNADVPRRLSADNPPLGSPGQIEIIDVDSNFLIGDRLILHTFQAGQAQNIETIELDEARFLEALMENFFLSPSKQVEAIFRKVSHKEGRALYKHPITVIGLENMA